MTMIVDGKFVRMGEASIELPTEDWAADFADFVERKGLNIAELVSRFEGKSGADIHSILRTESARNQAVRQTGVVASGKTKSLAKYRVQQLLGLDSVSAKVKTHWVDERDMCSDQASWSALIDNVTEVLKNHGVTIGDDSASTPAEGDASATARFQDDEDEG
jgi:hypothetical protein